MMTFKEYATTAVNKFNVKDREIIINGYNKYLSTQNIDKDKVEENFSDLETDESNLDSISTNKQNVINGKVASYIASDNTSDFNSVYNNINNYAKNFVKNNEATPEEVYNSINEKIINLNSFNTSDNAIDSILKDNKNRENLLNALQKESERQLAFSANRNFAPMPDSKGLAVFAAGVAQGILPDGVENNPLYKPTLDMITDDPSKADKGVFIAGEITGTVGSYFALFRGVRALGGVRKVPFINNALKNIAIKNPKTAMFVEQALNTFAVLNIRDQVYIDPNATLEERIANIDDNAILSLAFPAASYLGSVTKVGKIPVNTATSVAGGTALIFGTGYATGEGTPSQRLINGGILTLVWGLGQGLSYKEASKNLKTFLKQTGAGDALKKNPKLFENILKAEGVKPPTSKVKITTTDLSGKPIKTTTTKAIKIDTVDKFVDALPKNKILNNMNTIRAELYRQDLVSSSTKSEAKTDTPLSITEKINTAVNNQSSIVNLAKNNFVPPIDGARSSKQVDVLIKNLRKEQSEIARFTAANKQASIKEVAPVEKVTEEVKPTEVKPTEFNIGDKITVRDKTTGDIISGKYNVIFRQKSGMNAITIGGKTLYMTDTEGNAFQEDILFDKYSASSYEVIENKTTQKVKPTDVVAETPTKIPLKNIQKHINELKNVTDKNGTGQTFNTDLTVYDNSNTDKVIIVPIISENFSKETLKRAQMTQFLDKNKNAFIEDTKIGTFSLPDIKGQPSEVSFDVNVAVSENINPLLIVEYLNSTGQNSAWNGKLGEVIYNTVGNDGRNVVKFTPEEAKEVAESLRNGVLPIELINKKRIEQESIGNLYNYNPFAVLEEERRLLNLINNPQTLAVELASTPSSTADIVMHNVEKLVPELETKSKFEMPEEKIIPIPQQLNKINDAERTFGKLIQIFRKFGTAYVSDKTLSNKLETSYSEIASAPLRAIKEVATSFQQFPKTSKKDRMDITFAYESNRPQDLPDRLQPTYELVKTLMNDMEQAQVKAGILKRTFRETRQQRIDDLIFELSSYKNIPLRDAKIEQELESQIKFLQTVQQYLDHSIVLQRVVESKSKNLSKKERRNYQDKIVDFHRERKGKLTLKEYYDSGLLKEGDVDIVNLVMGTYVDGYQKLAIRSLVDWGKDVGYIVPKKEKLIYPDNYVLGKDTAYANRISDIKNFNIHVLFDDGFKEILGYNRKPSGWYQRLLASIKIGQFFNPAIIYKYNALQAFYGGSWTVNPKTITEAFQAVNSKNETFMEFDKFGLYQKQDLPIKREVDDLIRKYSKESLDMAGESFNTRIGSILENVGGFNKDEVLKMLKNKRFMDAITTTVSSPSQIVGNLTWYGDEVQRTMSALTLVKQGYTPKEAAQTAARIHGAYSLVGTPYKQAMRNIAFVYSFRMLMPWRYNIQPTATLLNEAYKGATGKERSRQDKQKTKKAAYTFGVTMGVPLVIDMTLRANGWYDVTEEEESGFRKAIDFTVIEIGEDGKYGKFRGAFPQWKYGKLVTVQDKNGNFVEKEIVLSIGNILNMGSKAAIRMTAPFPESTNLPYDRGFNYLQYEISPLYKLTLAYIFNEPVFDELPPRGVDGTDWEGGFEWLIKKSFVVYDETVWAEYLGLAEKGLAEKQLDEHLTGLEKTYKFFGNAYIRSTPDKRLQGKKMQFMKNLVDYARKIQFANVPEEEKEKEKKLLIEKMKKFKETLEEMKED